MKHRPILYCVRALPSGEILYIGESANMHRRLYTHRNEHCGLAYFRHLDFDYEVLYDQEQLPEQKRLAREVQLTAQYEPWWIFRCDLEHRQKWVKQYCESTHKPLFPLHKLPERQMSLF